MRRRPLARLLPCAQQLGNAVQVGEAPEIRRQIDILDVTVHCTGRAVPLEQETDGSRVDVGHASEVDDQTRVLEQARAFLEYAGDVRHRERAAYVAAAAAIAFDHRRAA